MAQNQQMHDQMQKKLEFAKRKDHNEDKQDMKEEPWTYR